MIITLPIHSHSAKLSQPGEYGGIRQTLAECAERLKASVIPAEQQAVILAKLGGYQTDFKTAVIASEVEALADQTARAPGEIHHQVAESRRRRAARCKTSIASAPSSAKSIK